MKGGFQRICEKLGNADAALPFRRRAVVAVNLSVVYQLQKGWPMGQARMDGDPAFIRVNRHTYHAAIQRDDVPRRFTISPGRSRRSSLLVSALPSRTITESKSGDFTTFHRAPVYPGHPASDGWVTTKLVSITAIFFVVEQKTHKSK
eukprot:GEMP01065809.1.p1 GENE.GEMP01065809.1~~GEMP01065809.1.p1  ORF type:complete len:147 (-),score=18.16 GEMP01065809.1:90-530(-)